MQYYFCLISAEELKLKINFAYSNLIGTLEKAIKNSGALRATVVEKDGQIIEMSIADVTKPV